MAFEFMKCDIEGLYEIQPKIFGDNRGVWKIVNKSPAGEKWNLGGEKEWQNIKLLNEVIDLTSKEIGKSAEEVRATITYVKDRPGHDKRYAIDCTKAKTKLG